MATRAIGIDNKMKVLIIQENGRLAQNRAFRECFSLQRAFIAAGHNAVVWGLGHPNYLQLPDFDRFDVIFNVENYDGSGWLPDLSRAKAYKIIWAIDEHWRGQVYYAKLFAKDKAQLWLHSTLDYVQKGAEHRWFPNCYDDSLIGRATSRSWPTSASVGKFSIGAASWTSSQRHSNTASRRTSSFLARRWCARSIHIAWRLTRTSPATSTTAISKSSAATSRS